LASELVKVAAIALAALSFVFLVAGAGGLLRSRAEVAAAPPEHSARRGGLILLSVSLLLLGGLWVLGDALGWDRNRGLWVGFGTFLTLMTVTRPWWFWEHYKARWLRGLIGDEPTALLYLALAGVMVWVGLFTDWPFGRR
jgi:hypothetical protein